MKSKLWAKALIGNASLSPTIDPCTNTNVNPNPNLKLGARELIELPIYWGSCRRRQLTQLLSLISNVTSHTEKGCLERRTIHYCFEAPRKNASKQ